MAENPPVITAQHCREFGHRFRRGEGVFVVTADEIETLGLSDFERSFLRPYYEASALDRYRVPGKPGRFVLYLTRGNAPDINAFPQIRRHLQRFRPILQRRRETRQGQLRWWQLHWPREERLFHHPRILSVQMGRVPQFAFAEAPTYVGFAVNLILRRPETRFALTTLTAILNSSLACRWFEHHAKRRGIHLEISGATLRQFPMPQSDTALEQELDRIVLDRQAIERPVGESHDLSQPRALERRIDALVCNLYRLTPESILGEGT
jgi:adenine-specific DNA-methyltransferase